MNNETTLTAGFVLPLLTVIHGSIASIMSTIVFFIIIYHQHNNRIKQEERITLILCANIYLCIFLCSTMLLLLNIQTLLGDLYGLNFDSTQCIFSGYLNLIFIYTLYYGFVTQQPVNNRIATQSTTNRDNLKTVAIIASIPLNNTVQQTYAQ
ncbi:unnamed protein product [Adineta steineri]|uniref:Uncharacterized protein n=1 Tax=Adineta steineri TaxID=433720 RepID=A0A814J5N8_9BILA|nr:unnamed protein product [Adineta steineri]